MEGISKECVENIAADEVMVTTVATSDCCFPTLSSDPVKSTDAKKPNEPMPWRSTRWIPLSYPISALLANAKITTIAHVDDESELNPFFPLHRDVLQAAIRELLILDGSIESKTLKLTSTTSMFRKATTDVTMSESIEADQIVVGPRYLNHVDAERFVELFVEDINLEHQKVRKKRTARSASQRSNKKKKKRINSSKSALVQIERKSHATVADVPWIDQGPDCAESLTRILIRRALHMQSDKRGNASEKPDCHQEKLDSPSLRPPRKISDDSIESDILLHEVASSYNEISRFIDLASKNQSGEYQLRSDGLPLLMDVSIASEQNLRQAAFGMVSKMTKSLSTRTLRLFLGYRASSVKREKILAVLSDFLYDVSHALFAWNETEQDLIAFRRKNGHAIALDGETDTIVKNLLFDEKALKKIGGFDDCSLLRHALSVSRSSSNRETWEDFALSELGQKLFAHHADGKAFLAGRKRRSRRGLHRLLPDSSGMTEEGNPRFRPSSLGTLIDEVKTDSKYKMRSSSDHSSFLLNSKWISTPNVCHLIQKRKVGETWGVVLAREGDMCVVDRGPQMGDADSGVRQGDMILSVKNERGECVSPPSALNRTEWKPCADWFQEIVLLFKSSTELFLVVRRV